MIFDMFHYFRIDKQQFDFSHFLVFTGIASKRMVVLLTFENIHKTSNMFTFQCEIFADSSTLPPQQNENEDRLKLLMKEELVEESDFVVAGFVVVEGVEEVQYQFAQTALDFATLMIFPQFEQQMFLEMGGM